MMRIPWFLVVSATVALTVSCRQHDFRTVTIHVPEMKNAACYKIAHDAVLAEIKRCQAFHQRKRGSVNMEARTITVTYNSLRLAVKNLEFAIAKAGFTARAESSPKGVVADKKAQAKLPPECSQEGP